MQELGLTPVPALVFVQALVLLSDRSSQQVLESVPHLDLFDPLDSSEVVGPFPIRDR